MGCTQYTVQYLRRWPAKFHHFNIFLSRFEINAQQYLYVSSYVSVDSLKRQSHEIFGIFFMNQTYLGRGPLINRFKCFFLKIRFSGDIRGISDFAQANTARCQTLRRLTLRGVRLCAV